MTYRILNCIFPCCSPDIQVGTPLIDIVEKVLESKAKELLPKISESVEFLCEAKAKQLVEAQEAPIIPVTFVANTPKSDYVDLSLPIDLPGLSTPAKTVKPQGVAGKQENKPKAIKKGTIEPQKAKAKPSLSGVKTVKDDSKLKSDSKEQKEKEKPKVYRIPKKPKVDNVDKQDNESNKLEVKSSGAPLSKEKADDEPKPLSKRRSTRLASQTDSKASSDNEHSDGKVTPIRKRRRVSGGMRGRIYSSSEESDISSDDYESDTDQESDGESSQEHYKSSNKISRHHNDSDKWKDTSRKKPKHSKKMRSSKSPPMIVTRYNRSVKPNKRYTDTCMDDSQSTLEETSEYSQGEDELPLTLTLDTTRSCDNGEMEIQDNAVLVGDERGNVVYQMLKPKPKAIKVKKILLRGMRSRNRTHSRINFFQHR